jgi:hypothetical protein
MTVKYPVLRVLIWAFRVIAFLSFLIGIAGGVITATSPSIEYDFINGTAEIVPTSDAQRGAGFGIIVTGIVLGLFLQATAEVIRIQINNAEQLVRQTIFLARIERNTRAAEPMPITDGPTADTAALRELRRLTERQVPLVPADEITATRKDTLLRNRLRPDVALDEDN